MARFRSRPEWAVGFADEVWWSRLARPQRHTWTQAVPERLIEQTASKADLEPLALACYGLLCADTGTVRLRFVDGRPISRVTTRFLQWLADGMAAAGKRALLLIWDNASWHISKEVRQWLKAHNRRVKQEGGCRLLACFLPSKSPWLNNIEPKWIHGKRAIAEADRKLTVAETRKRICDYYGCQMLDPLSQQVE